MKHPHFTKLVSLSIGFVCTLTHIGNLRAGDSDPGDSDPRRVILDKAGQLRRSLVDVLRNTPLSAQANAFQNQWRINRDMLVNNWARYTDAESDAHRLLRAYQRSPDEAYVVEALAMADNIVHVMNDPSAVTNPNGQKIVWLNMLATPTRARIVYVPNGHQRLTSNHHIHEMLEIAQVPGATEGPIAGAYVVNDRGKMQLESYAILNTNGYGLFNVDYSGDQPRFFLTLSGQQAARLPDEAGRKARREHREKFRWDEKLP